MNKKKLYLASGNKHKQKEMQELLPDFEIRIPSDDGIEFAPIEDGKSFYENSLIKARALWNLVHEPVIADDSGICVSALKGEPGIYTSRYAGPNFMHGKPDGSKISQEEQNRFLIEQLNATGSRDRSCHYTCAMVLLLNPERFFVAQETFEGELIPSIEKQAGSGGFGYDPIVWLPQYKKTVAEISAEEKNKISHRGKAVQTIKQVLENLIF
ncbi:MAG: RdgB/HAM1 family non-canonical purine NTP pyrophosphatase [Treponema sp.]|uniref:RdgB/HAM1 family non-canonical purine NTP pyrophosphatase n=1 Tax=Treponema sp. TaxID=166 RepID=UPI001C1C3B64|nr:RdgB/HAM1 family non-canonical purine NTP pyrophosphatase [Treponema sp.]MBQ8680077.1 RdgB/HAM1 family non-canonical purine NTP pyrophosphatase [Treponema sp.]MBR1535738.1 RdgB/HAM1 family non-canonical purine NTP pyrophosphatase [Treponema sp.]